LIGAAFYGEELVRDFRRMFEDQAQLAA